MRIRSDTAKAITSGWATGQSRLQRELLRAAIDTALEKRPDTIDELWITLQKAGCEVKHRGKTVSLQAPNHKTPARLSSLGEMKAPAVRGLSFFRLVGPMRHCLPIRLNLNFFRSFSTKSQYRGRCFAGSAGNSRKRRLRRFCRTGHWNQERQSRRA